MTLARLTLLVALLLVPLNAYAFPEMVRKGYGNCTSCHLSPAGGGILTEYGRELSLEALSWKGTETEAAFAYSLVKPPEWVLGGGDVRYVQTYINTPYEITGRGIWMQADLAGAVNFDKFAADATAGIDEYGNFISRNHYLIYRPFETVSLRGGRFMPAFGIGFAEHYLEVRHGLQLNDISFQYTAESYNLEAAYLGEKINVFATGIFGRPDDPSLNHETGFSAVASYYFADRYKVGASFYTGKSALEPQYRQIYGPWGILGFTSTLSLLTEWDFQTNNAQFGGQLGLATYNKLDYEIFKGMHVFVTQELGHYNFSDSSTVDEAYGVGAQFFPRPHFDFESQYQKRRQNGSPYMFDYFYVMAHFYP